MYVVKLNTVNKEEAKGATDMGIKLGSLVIVTILICLFLTGCKEANPIVTLIIEDKGEIKLELYPKKAPNTVNNFIHLVQEGFYDGLTFHRIVPGFVIQGGDPEGKGTGGPGYRIQGEFANNGFKKNNLKHTEGILSMARSSHPDSAGSQFFIMLGDAPSLDGDFAAFGKVIKGMYVVEEIASVKTDSKDFPKEPQVIEKATVELFGKEYPEPETIE